MNKRDAKREACRIAAAVLDSLKDTETYLAHADGTPTTPEEANMLEAAMDDLVAELDRRGGTFTKDRTDG